ncbi:hypothetical protein [Streptomyces sp. NPDC058268]|uniref:hypothetical protein n=1 Tax=Streptomyces sp. NPDC058268 TaxID=3346413 RepID=UPI0036EE388E
MEILLIAACAWLAYTAGAQSEQSQLGIPPAQRDQMREQTRHEKAVRKIAEKHGGATPSSSGSTSPWKDRRSAAGGGSSDTFMSGYRASRPDRPPLGRRAGERAGQGMTWAQGAGRDAWHRYRERRKREGHDGPELVMVPHPPEYLPTVPPIPATSPPAVDATPAQPNAPPPTGATDTATAPDKNTPGKPAETTAKKPAPTTAEAPRPDTPVVDDKTAPGKPATEPVPDAPKADPPKPDEPADTGKPAEANPEPQPADTPQGVGRMASEVTYDSVMDESDELSIMCEEDARVCDRIRDRAEREIGRGDTLGVEMKASGWGSKILGWLSRCKESYGVIRSEVDALQHNTIAQGESVVMAKSYLQAGQGVYADIAEDMETVLDRQAYISDAVDAEDTSAHTEIYETKVAS